MGKRWLVVAVASLGAVVNLFSHPVTCDMTQQEVRELVFKVAAEMLNKSVGEIRGHQRLENFYKGYHSRIQWDIRQRCADIDLPYSSLAYNFFSGDQTANDLVELVFLYVKTGAHNDSKVVFHTMEYDSPAAAVVSWVHPITLILNLLNLLDYAASSNASEDSTAPVHLESEGDSIDSEIFESHRGE